MSHIFASLSLLTWVGTLTIGAGHRAADFRPDSAVAALFDDLGAIALWLGWIVAAVTMGGSLYYSQVANFIPCELCWAQRICLYPFAIVLLVAALRRDRKVWTYVVPVAVIGAGIASYHVQLQAYPGPAVVLLDARALHHPLRVGVRVRLPAVHVAGRVDASSSPWCWWPGPPTPTATTISPRPDQVGAV